MPYPNGLHCAFAIGEEGTGQCHTKSGCLERKTQAKTTYRQADGPVNQGRRGTEGVERIVPAFRCFVIEAMKQKISETDRPRFGSDIFIVTRPVRPGNRVWLEFATESESVDLCGKIVLPVVLSVVCTALSTA